MKPEPVGNAQIDQMNALQRATESFRYVLLSIEHWVSPSGNFREWLRHNVRLGAWLFIPALLVMPAISLILWHLTGWLNMLTSITGKLFLVLLLLFAAKIFTALMRR